MALTTVLTNYGGSVDVTHVTHVNFLSLLPQAVIKQSSSYELVFRPFHRRFMVFRLISVGEHGVLNRLL